MLIDFQRIRTAVDGILNRYVHWPSFGGIDGRKAIHWDSVTATFPSAGKRVGNYHKRKISAVWVKCNGIPAGTANQSCWGTIEELYWTDYYSALTCNSVWGLTQRSMYCTAVRHYTDWLQRQY